MYIRFPAVVISLLGVLVALLTSSFTALILFEIGLAALCLCDAVCAPSTTLIEVTHEVLAPTRVGEHAPVILTARSSSARTIRAELRNAWPPSAGVTPSRFSFVLAPQGETILSGTMNPTRRGTRKSEHVTLRTRGPLGLAGRQRSRPTYWELRVLPEFSARKHLPSRIARLRELEGRALLLVRGQGTEFDSLREYVAGDDVRAIDWRSTARLGNTVVRTWRPERDRRVIILADCGRAGALRIGGAPAFDAYIESSLLMAALTTRAGDRTVTCALDSRVRARVADAKGTPIINRLGEALADVEPSLNATDWNLAASTIAQITHQPALVIILTTLGISSVTDGLIDAASQLAHTHTVLVGSLQEAYRPLSAHPNTQESYMEAAQAKAELENNAVASALRRLGCSVVQADCAHLPPKIADTYIELKAAGKL